MSETNGKVWKYFYYFWCAWFDTVEGGSILCEVVVGFSKSF